MKLSAARVQEIFVECLLGKEPNGHICIIADGIMHRYAFDPTILESHREEVSAMLNELPDAFHEGAGGGWSFLNACVDKEENLWGQHRDMEALFCLGMGLGKVKCLMPRDMWKALPGGMPYYTVLTEPQIIEAKLAE